MRRACRRTFTGSFSHGLGLVTRRRTVPPMVTPVPQGTSYCRLVFDGLGRGRDDIHELLCGVIGGARERGRQRRRTFCRPANFPAPGQRGAARRRRASHPACGQQSALCAPASRHMQPGLIRKGVRIFFQPPPFAHTKLSCGRLLRPDWVRPTDPRSLFLNLN